MVPGVAHVSEVLEKVPELVKSVERLLVCAIYDTKACEVFGGNVFTCRTSGEAIRMFSDGVNYRADRPTVIQLHPEDFRLVQIGWLDRVSCSVEGVYRVLIEGSEVKVSE